MQPFLTRVLNRAKRTWWTVFVPLSGRSFFGRMMGRVAVLFSVPYKGRSRLAGFSTKGFISPWATIYHPYLQTGRYVFIGDRVTIYHGRGGGVIQLGDRVKVYNDAVLETGRQGSISIGAESRIHPGCHLAAYHSPIIVGQDVGIAQRCALYSYNHGVAPGIPVSEQPLESRGPIVIGDHVWLGAGVIVLDGVHIGNDAVIGAGSVVNSDVPPGAIAAGVPARILKYRSQEQLSEALRKRAEREGNANLREALDC